MLIKKLLSISFTDSTYSGQGRFSYATKRNHTSGGAEEQMIKFIFYTLHWIYIPPHLRDRVVSPV